MAVSLAGAASDTKICWRTEQRAWKHGVRPRFLWTLLALGACEFLTGDHTAKERRAAVPREPYAGHLMPVEVAGIALGQDWLTLKKNRPAITHDSAYPTHGGPMQHFVGETNDSVRVTYFFSEPGRPDTALRGPSPAARLSGVELWPAAILRSDTAAYRRAVAARIARWDSLVGPADSVEVCWPVSRPGTPEPWELRRWHRADVTLLLGTTPDEYLTPEPSRDTLWQSRPAAQWRSMLLVVRSARLRDDEGVSGFIRSVSRCTMR